MPCQAPSNQMNRWTQPRQAQRAPYRAPVARAVAYARPVYAARSSYAAPSYAAPYRAQAARPRANLWRARQAQVNDCGSCKAACAEGYEECESHCCEFEQGSPEYEACRLQCEVDARECEHETCVGTGRCPEVLCPRPAPAPTPCQACKLGCAADAAECEDGCADKEGVNYLLCKKRCELRKFDCIDSECFATKKCCEWEPSRPIDGDWEPTRPIDDDGEPTEPIPDGDWDPTRPIDDDGEPTEPIPGGPGEPGEPDLGALGRYLRAAARQQRNVAVYRPRAVSQAAAGRFGRGQYGRRY